MASLYEICAALLVGALVLLIAMVRTRQPATPMKDASSDLSAKSLEQQISELEAKEEKDRAPKKRAKQKAATVTASEKSGLSEQPACDSADTKTVGPQMPEGQPAEEQVAQKQVGENGVVAAKAVAKQKALRLQAAKQAAQRKARETQRLVALERAETQKARRAAEAADTAVREVLAAVDGFIDAKGKKLEGERVVLAIIEELLVNVESHKNQRQEEQKLVIRQPKRHAKEDGVRHAAGLSALERDIMKYEKKFREVCKLNEKQEAGERLDPKQVEKLSQAELVISRLDSLYEDLKRETETLSNHSDDLEEESPAFSTFCQEYEVGEQRLEEQEVPLEQDGRQAPSGSFQLLTKQALASGLGKLPACAPESLLTKQAPASMPACAADGINITAPPLGARILLRPEGLGRPGDAAGIAPEPILSHKDKQRQYAEARARIFSEALGRGKGSGRGRGAPREPVRSSRVGPAIATGRGSRSHPRVRGEKAHCKKKDCREDSHEARADPDYNRDNVRLLRPAAADDVSDSSSMSGTESAGRSTDSDIIVPYW